MDLGQRCWGVIQRSGWIDGEGEVEKKKAWLSWDMDVDESVTSWSGIVPKTLRWHSKTCLDR